MFFQEEACRMAWRLLTEVYQLPPSLLYVTYFRGDEELGLEADLEVKHIWRGIGCVTLYKLNIICIICKGCPFEEYAWLRAPKCEILDERVYDIKLNNNLSIFTLFFFADIICYFFLDFFRKVKIF